MGLAYKLDFETPRDRFSSGVFAPIEVVSTTMRRVSSTWGRIELDLSSALYDKAVYAPQEEIAQGSIRRKAKIMRTKDMMWGGVSFIALEMNDLIATVEDFGLEFEPDAVKRVDF